MSCPIDSRLVELGWMIDRGGKKHAKIFLTHIHEDHITGIQRGSSPIYLSALSAQLLAFRFPEIKHRFVKLPFNQPIWVDQVQVVAIPSHHCPGSIMLAFLFSDGYHILYTGDLVWFPTSKLSLTRFDKVYYDSSLTTTRFPGLIANHWNQTAQQVVAYIQSSYQSDPTTEFHLNVRILGIELILNRIQRICPDWYFQYSSNIPKWRREQIQFLFISSAASANNQQQTSPRLILDYKPSRVLTKSLPNHQQWILFNCTPRLVIQKSGNHETSSHIRGFWFCTHMSQEQFQEFQKHVSAQEWIPCSKSIAP